VHNVVCCDYLLCHSNGTQPHRQPQYRPQIDYASVKTILRNLNVEEDQYLGAGYEHASCKGATSNQIL